MRQPQMIPGEVEMVSVEWILQNTTGSVDGFEGPSGYGIDYVDMMREKTGDWGFGYLLASILYTGFRIPIVLSMNYGGETEQLFHGNGHHRFCAAILLGLDRIPVYWDNDEDFMSEHISESEEDLDTDLESRYPDWYGFHREMQEIDFG